MTGVLARWRAALRHRPTVRFYDRCASVAVCDTACRAAAARDPATAAYLSLPGPRSPAR